MRGQSKNVSRLEREMVTHESVHTLGRVLCPAVVTTIPRTPKYILSIHLIMILITTVRQSAVWCVFACVHVHLQGSIREDKQEEEGLQTHANSPESKKETKWSIRYQ